MKKLLILGAGGYGKTVADLAAQLGGYSKIAFLDDGQTGGNILGTCQEFEVFAEAILNDTNVLTDAREGAKTVEVCLAIVESANIGKAVNPNYEF